MGINEIYLFLAVLGIWHENQYMEWKNSNLLFDLGQKKVVIKKGYGRSLKPGLF